MPQHLPIFPLPLVLVPGEVLPLYIFEPRYRQMLKDAALDDNQFGVSFFNPSESFTDKPDAGSVGCAALVRNAQTMPDGTSNIITIGAARYHLIDYVDDARAPYLIGEVEYFEDEEEDAAVLEPLAAECAALLQRLNRAALQITDSFLNEAPIAKNDAPALSFLAAAAVNPTPDVKYKLLEMRSTIERLTKMSDIMRVVVGTIEESAAINKVAKTNGHSKKKINF